jgi:hypothetical protein
MGTNATLDRIVLPAWAPDRGPVEPKWTITQLLAARCVSIGEVSRTSGLSRATVTRAVRGTCAPTMPTRRRLAQALGVEPDAIAWAQS